jgi:hydroxymethylbilane synthase
MKQHIIRIATRQSPLALWQANRVRDQLQQCWPDLTIELLPLVTSGDTFLKDKLLVAGGKGLFVKELEEALLAKKADIAVHSSKDMPADLPKGLSLAVVCKRDNPFDALVSHQHIRLADLPANAVIGTSSLRRASQLLAYRPDFQIKTLRGNIQTRLAKLEAGEFQAIILAAAGLIRMSMDALITELLPEDIMLPSCGQGAVCIECRSDDEAIQQLIQPLNDADTALCVHTERLVNAQLGGNCHVPLAVFCTNNAPDSLLLRAKILSPDGTTIIQSNQTGTRSQATEMASECTNTLLEQGAAQLLSNNAV